MLTSLEKKGYAMPINGLCVCTMEKEDVDNCIVFAETKGSFGNLLYNR